jgi:hypothetical protein
MHTFVKENNDNVEISINFYALPVMLYINEMDYNKNYFRNGHNLFFVMARVFVQRKITETLAQKVYQPQSEFDTIQIQDIHVMQFG